MLDWQQEQAAKRPGGDQGVAGLTERAHHATACFGLGVTHRCLEQARHAGAKHRVVDVQIDREHLRGDLGGNAKHLIVVGSRIQAHGLVH